MRLSGRMQKLNMPPPPKKKSKIDTPQYVLFFDSFRDHWKMPAEGLRLRHCCLTALFLCVFRSRPPCWTFPLWPTCSSSSRSTRDSTWSRSCSRYAASFAIASLCADFSLHSFCCFFPPGPDSGGSADFHLHGQTGSGQSPCFQSSVCTVSVSQHRGHSLRGQDPRAGPGAAGCFRHRRTFAAGGTQWQR